MSQLFQELKRRNVFRVAFAYLAVAWLILQAADIVLDNIEAPAWLMKALMFFMVAGFPVAMIFAWAFEMTPEGIKREAEVDRSTSITQQTGKKLNRVIIGVLGVAVVFLLIDKFQPGETEAPLSTTSEKSVAVLPFVAMSSGPDDEYFADGLTEEVLNSLTRLPELLVTARTSAFHFKGRDLPIPEIAATLGVAHIVEGSVRRDGSRLRVTAQLIRASDGFHLWSENYDRDSQDTFAVQTSIAEKIAASLDVVLDDAQRKQMLESGVRNPEAFIAYQKGVEIFEEAHGSADLLGNLRKANGWFDLATQLEPDFSDAYAYASDYYSHVLIDSIRLDDISEDEQTRAMQAVVEHFEKAIRFASSEGARIAAAYDLAVVSGQWRKLPALFDDSQKAKGCVYASWSLETANPFGRAKGILAEGLLESECNPMGFSGWVKAVAAYINLGKNDLAIETAERGLQAAPHIRIYQHLIFAYIAAGRFDEAEAIIDRHVHLDNQSESMRAMLAAARGDAESASNHIDNILTLESHEFDRFPVMHLAQIGERDAANRMAAEIDAHPFGYLELMVYPQLCRCGAPFDLEYTPNYAKLVKDADLPWPPISPINWPLKDW